MKIAKKVRPQSRLQSIVRQMERNKVFVLGLLVAAVAANIYAFLSLGILQKILGQTGNGTPATTNMTFSVSRKSDDAEETVATGKMSLSGTALHLGSFNGQPDIVGLRFGNVNVPKSTVIAEAYVIFHVDEPKNTATTLNISGENTANSQSFKGKPYDLSSRTKTAGIPWNITETWSSGEVVRTSNVDSIVTQIMARPDWKQGNAVSLFFVGTGERWVKSFRSSRTAAAQLVINYAVPVSPTPTFAPTPTAKPTFPPTPTLTKTPTPTPALSSPTPSPLGGVPCNTLTGIEKRFPCSPLTIGPMPEKTTSGADAWDIFNNILYEGLADNDGINERFSAVTNPVGSGVVVRNQNLLSDTEKHTTVGTSRDLPLGSTECSAFRWLWNSPADFPQRGWTLVWQLQMSGSPIVAVENDKTTHAWTFRTRNGSDTGLPIKLADLQYGKWAYFVTCTHLAEAPDGWTKIWFAYDNWSDVNQTPFYQRSGHDTYQGETGHNTIGIYADHDGSSTSYIGYFDRYGRALTPQRAVYIAGNP